MSPDVSERAFEETIEATLLRGSIQAAPYGAGFTGEVPIAFASATLPAR